MEKFKGTPGIWSVSFHGSDNCWIVDSDNDSAIAKVTRYKGDGDIQRANFKLIAAAPELLEAIRQLRDYVEDVCAVSSVDCDEQHPLMLATAAIKKALGQ